MGVRRRLTLRRGDGDVYLDRWGLSHPRIGGVLVHRMTAPDPGVDLHDHPWWFGSLILWGGYDEERNDTRTAPFDARFAEAIEGAGGRAPRGWLVERRWLSWRSMRLDECHRIIRLRRRTCWTLVVNGPRRRTWGFYEPKGWVKHTDSATERRDLAAERPDYNEERP